MPPLPFDPSVLITSSADSLQSGLIIFGAFGVGKTWLAGSASKHWPKTIPSTEPVVLSDCLWIKADVGATEGFTPNGISVPTIDIPNMLTPAVAGDETPKPRDIGEALQWTTHAAAHAVQEQGVSHIIVDTVSMLDRYIVDYWSKDENIPKNGKGEPDSRGKWGCVAQTHFRFWQSLTFLPAKTIFLCHAKTNESELATIEGKKIKRDEIRNSAKSAAVGTAGDNTIVPRISGSSAEVYLANVGLQLVLHAEQSLGSREFTRTLHPFGRKGGWQAKNRYQQFFKQEEPADLQHIYTKMQGGI